MDVIRCPHHSSILTYEKSKWLPDFAFLAASVLLCCLVLSGDNPLILLTEFQMLMISVQSLVQLSLPLFLTPCQCLPCCQAACGVKAPRLQKMDMWVKRPAGGLLHCALCRPPVTSHQPLYVAGWSAAHSKPMVLQLFQAAEQQMCQLMLGSSACERVIQAEVSFLSNLHLSNALLKFISRRCTVG